MTSKEFRIIFTDHSLSQLTSLKSDPAKKGVAKAVIKSIVLMTHNLKHPSLNTHKFDALSGPNGEVIFETYAQNKTPGAYRIFWYYGPEKLQITVIEICPHP